eukprot:1155075-Pelagomonas_calceolata.AAC.1
MACGGPKIVCRAVFPRCGDLNTCADLKNMACGGPKIVCRAVFPRHVATWDDLDRRAASQRNIMGGGDVLRYLRTHIKR